MSTSNWNRLSIVHSLDDVKAANKSNSVCQYRINNLKSLKCLV